MISSQVAHDPAGRPSPPCLPDAAEPDEWSNHAGYRWEWHAHSVAKVVLCRRGSVTFHGLGQDIEMGEGDRLEIPLGVLHAATAGDAGVTCLEIRLPSVV